MSAGLEIHRELGRGRFGLPDARHPGGNDLDVAGRLQPPQRLAVAAARDEQRAPDLHADVVASKLLLREAGGCVVEDRLKAVPVAALAARSNAKDHLAVVVPGPRALLPHIELTVTRSAPGL